MCAPHPLPCQGEHKVSVVPLLLVEGQDVSVGGGVEYESDQDVGGAGQYVGHCLV